jgi:VanZ family protein
MIKESVYRWLPAIFMMSVIFMASNTPGSSIPNFGALDVVLKKAGHISIYCLLTIAGWYGFRFEKGRWWLVFLMVILYAVSDEFHQSFIPGRHPSWIDVTVFDGGGAILGLLISAWQVKKKGRMSKTSTHSS